MCACVSRTGSSSVTGKTFTVLVDVAPPAFVGRKGKALNQTLCCCSLLPPEPASGPRPVTSPAKGPSRRGALPAPGAHSHLISPRRRRRRAPPTLEGIKVETFVYLPSGLTSLTTEVDEPFYQVSLSINR